MTQWPLRVRQRIILSIRHAIPQGEARLPRELHARLWQHLVPALKRPQVFSGYWDLCPPRPTGDFPPAARLAAMAAARELIAEAEAQAAAETGLQASAPQDHGRRLTAVDVATARRAYLNGASFTALSERYAVNWKTVRDAVHGRTYRHVIDPPPVPVAPQGGATQFTEHDLRELARMRGNAASWREIGAHFGVAASTVLRAHREASRPRPLRHVPG